MFFCVIIIVLCHLHTTPTNENEQKPMDFLLARQQPVDEMLFVDDVKKVVQNFQFSELPRPLSGVLWYTRNIMLPKKNRITTNYFPTVLRGKTHQDEVLRVVFYHEESQQYPRCAVIVNKKQASSAVERNHIRRFCYQILSENKHHLPNSLISLVVKKKNPTDHELKNSILQLCVKK